MGKGFCKTKSTNAKHKILVNRKKLCQKAEFFISSRTWCAHFRL